MRPWYLNFFEDIPTVQFDHRWLAKATFAFVMITWVVARQLGDSARVRANVLMLAALVQVALGIATLLLVVPIPLAAAHQAGAVVLFACSIWLRHGLRCN